MNSKAIKRQLLAAIAMVLVAALALGSSTYAWFVASGNVTATGMKVQAQSEAGLVIRYGSGSWGTTATGEKNPTTSAKLNPTSTADLDTWYHANATYANAFGADAATRATVLEAEYSQYFLVEEFAIRSAIAGKEVSGLYVPSVVVTGQTDKPLSTALRVGIAFRTESNETLTDATENNFVIFAPVELDTTNKPTYTYNVYTGPSDVSGTEVTALKADEGTAENALLVDGGVKIPSDKNGGVIVQIYVWYEGEDHALFTDNYVAQDLSVSVNFTSIPSTT